MKKTLSEKQKICYGILLFGIILRTVIFIINIIINECHCDEAMLFLNAASIADNSTDITGEHLPAYFDTWVYGGQSPFATYIIAIFIKAFGNSLFVSRLPLFIFSILGLWCFYRVSSELFGKDSNYTVTAVTLCALSPWQIMDSMFTLDCNFLPHLIIFGTYFLIRAVKYKKKALNFIISMLFFGLGFYCYVLSALIIPVILLCLYVIFLAEKKIRFRHALLSAAVIGIIAIPYIVFVLVLYGYAEPVRFLGYNISIPNYNFHQFIEFDSVKDKVYYAAINALTSLLNLALPDTEILVSPIFLYTNFLGGIFTVIGIIKVIADRKKGKHNPYSFAIIITGAITAAVISAVTKSPLAHVFYRFNAVNYFLLISGGCGFGTVINGINFKNVIKIRKTDLKKGVAAFIAFSLIVTGLNYYAHVKFVNANSLYGKTAKQAFDYIEDYNGAKDIVLINVYNRETVFLRYFIKDKEYLPYDKDYFLRNDFEVDSGTPAELTPDGSVKYIGISKKTKVDFDCMLLYEESLELLDFDKTQYDITRFGERIVITRKK